MGVICPNCGREERTNVSKYMELCGTCVQMRLGKPPSKREKRKLRKAEKKAQIEKAVKRRRKTSRAKVDIPKKLLKHPQVGSLLREYVEGNNTPKLRKELRDLGFRLSDPSTWKKFMEELK